MKFSPLVIYTWAALIAAVAAGLSNKRILGRAVNPISPSRGDVQPPSTSEREAPSTAAAQSTSSPSSPAITPEPTSNSPPAVSTPESSSSAQPSTTSLRIQSTSAPLSTSLPSLGSSSSLKPSSSSSSYSFSLAVPSSSTPVSSAPPAPSSGGGPTSTALIAGSVCGFVAILAIGFGYAFFSKVRKNKRKERVFGDEDDGPAPPPPPPPPFVAGRPLGDDSLSAGWDGDYKRSPSPMLTRPSPPAASRQIQDQDYYNQYGGYEHTGGYEQHAGYEQHTGSYDAYAGGGYQQQGYQPDPHTSPYQQHAAYGGYPPQQPYH